MDMTLDVTQELVGYDGEVLMDARPKLDKDGKPVLDAENKPVPERFPVTLRPVCINALSAQLEADKGMAGTKKTEIWELCGKLHREDRPQMTSEQVTLIKDRISAVYPPLLVGPALLAMNGTPASPKLADKAK